MDEFELTPGMLHDTGSHLAIKNVLDRVQGALAAKAEDVLQGETLVVTVAYKKAEKVAPVAKKGAK